MLPSPKANLSGLDTLWPQQYHGSSPGSTVGLHVHGEEVEVDGQLLDVNDVATLLKVSPRTVRRLRASGQITAVPVGTRLVRYTTDSVREYVANQCSASLMAG